MAPTIHAESGKEKRLLSKTSNRPISDFVCRPKYSNTLPDIPLITKFLVYPFDSTRYVRYKPTLLERNYKYDLWTEHDLGVTIDLIDPDTYAIQKKAQLLDPKDEELLDDDRAGSESRRSRSYRHNRKYPWLHRPQYISTERTKYQPQCVEQVEAAVGYNVKKALLKGDALFLDRTAQILAIEKTFTDSQMSIEKHVNKSDVYPVEIIPVFPDFQFWKYAFAEVRFQEEPTPRDKPVELQENYMNKAMIRGVMDECGEQFVAYFLPTEETLVKYEDSKDGVGWSEYRLCHPYDWTVKNKASKSYKEDYFFVFREDAVYYNEIETRVRLTKRHKQLGQSHNTRMFVTYRPFNDLEYDLQFYRESQLKPHLTDESSREDPGMKSKVDDQMNKVSKDKCQEKLIPSMKGNDLPDSKTCERKRWQQFENNDPCCSSENSNSRLKGQQKHIPPCKEKKKQGMRAIKKSTS